MAALRWDEQAQAYTESETPLKYEPTVGAWTETTGLAWDPEAQAWTEKWGTQVSAYVYGAVSETITIRKDGIIVATVQTDSTGKSAEQITLSNGTYTLTGSVSGWTEEQTVNNSTTKFRAMPEGALYWYGNECTWFTGGWNANTIIDGNGAQRSGYISNKNINVSLYTSISMIHSGSFTNDSFYIVRICGKTNTSDVTDLWLKTSNPTTNNFSKKEELSYVFNDLDKTTCYIEECTLEGAGGTRTPYYSKYTNYLYSKVVQTVGSTTYIRELRCHAIWLE